MVKSNARFGERRCSTRWQLSAGVEVRVRRLGPRAERPGVLRDASSSGALLESSSRFGLGTLLQVSLSEVMEPVLVTIVRAGIVDGTVRRYGVACLQGEFSRERVNEGSTGRLAGDGLQSLGLTWPATPNDVRRAYRSLALQAHPDVGGSDERFRALHQAYLDAMALCKR